jgi:hypothetical protein
MEGPLVYSSGSKARRTGLTTVSSIIPSFYGVWQKRGTLSGMGAVFDWRTCHRNRRSNSAVEPRFARRSPRAFGREALMSIYATLWRLKFPRYGDDHTGCDWVEVIAQGVPAHIGASTSSPASEENDPYADFLPPAGAVPTDDDRQTMRAVVFVTEGTPKGTARSPQEYVRPLLVLSGREYATTTFGQLHDTLCNALRGERPRLLAESWEPDGLGRLLFEDGSVRDIESAGA